MSSPFGIVGFLFSKNLPLLVGVVGLDYLGMYFLNLGDVIENVMFFLMIFLAFILANRVHSGSDYLKVLVILFLIDMLFRWGLYAILPSEITNLTMENMIQGTL